MPLPPPVRSVRLMISSRKSVAQITLPPMRMRPNTCGMTAPSPEPVIRAASRRAPSTRCVSPPMSMPTTQLSTTEPTVVPIMPPMVAAETPRIVPPMAPPIAAPAMPNAIAAMA